MLPRLRTTIIAILISAAYAGWPVTQPGTINGRSLNQGPTWIWEGGEKVPVPYNMVDAYPSCHSRGYCPMFEPGTKLSAFPNGEEKWQHMIHNVFRMFGNQTLDIKWGKWQLAVNKNLGRTYYCKGGCDYCGSTHPDKRPLYWYSDANQAARFKQYDENACDQDYYDEPGVNAHTTCKWVLDEFGGGSHCDLFGGQCSFEARGVAFSPEDDAWFETEGICGANTCYRDAHCDPIFANKYDYQGTGFIEGMNGASGVYSRATDEINYTLHSGAHLDQRMRIVYEDRNNDDGKYFTLMAGYFDVEKKDNMDKCWSIYNGTYHEMEVEVSLNLFNGSYLLGGVRRGTKFLSDSYNVVVASYHEPPTDTCEPYAFVCRSQSGKYFRLPEDEDYYFGTEWSDWAWSDYEGNWNLSCKENHYYYNKYEDDGEGAWVVNSGYRVMNATEYDVLYRDDIWYYQEGNTCIGCSKIAALQCTERCLVHGLCDNCPYLPQVEPEKKEESKETLAGIILLIILILILVCGGIALWIWWRLKKGMGLLPRSASSRAKNDESQISKQISADNDRLAIHQAAPSTGYDPPAPPTYNNGLPPPVPSDAIPYSEGNGGTTGDHDLDI